MWEILGGLFLATALSGVIPLINAEILVVAAAAAVPTAGLPLVAAISTVGQMTTKGALFGVARWAPARLPARATAAIDRATGALSDRKGSAWTLIFASAVTGLPPFYGVSIASGALRIPPLSFFTAGGAGRLLRFGVLVLAARGLLGG